MKITNDSRVLLVYFSDRNAKNQTLMHKGTAGEFREEVGSDWNGFNLGDRFEIDFGNEGVKKVRVFKMSSTLLENDEVHGHQYFVGPAELNSNDVDMTNMNFDDYSD